MITNISYEMIECYDDDNSESFYERHILEISMNLTEIQYTQCIEAIGYTPCDVQRGTHWVGKPGIHNGHWGEDYYILSWKTEDFQLFQTLFEIAK